MKVRQRVLLLLFCSLAFLVCRKDDEQLDIINISNTRGRSENPAIASDSRGYFYVVWEEKLLTRESLFIYIAIREPSGEWSEPEKIFAPLVGQFPDIAIDQHNTIHVMWRNTNPQGWGEVLYTKKRLGCMWTEPETISVYGMSCNPDFAVDNIGNVHMVWREWPTYSRKYIFYSRRTSDGAWSIPVEISIGEAFSRGAPHIATNRSGDLHIVWEETKTDFGPFLAMYSASMNSDSFTHPEAIDYSDYYLDNQIYPSISTDFSDIVHVVWETDDDIFYTSKEPNAEWCTPIRICSTDAHSSLPHIAADANGKIHVVWFEDSRQLGYVSIDPEHNWSETMYYPVDIMCLMEPKPAIGTNSIGVAFSATWELDPGGKDNTEIFFVEVPMY